MRTSFQLFAAALLWVGCESEPSASEPVPSEPAAPAAQAEAKGPVIDDPTFKLALAQSEPGQLSLSLEGRGGYHVNQEFPFNADFSGSSEGVKLPKKSLGKDDAVEFSEARATFQLPVEVSEGAQKVEAKVRFAVCTDDTCVPDTRTVALALGE